MTAYLIRDNYVGYCLRADLSWGADNPWLITNRDTAVQALNAARVSDYYRRQHADAIQLVTLPEKDNERRKQRTFRPRNIGLPRRPTGHN